MEDTRRGFLGALSALAILPAEAVKDGLHNIPTSVPMKAIWKIDHGPNGARIKVKIIRTSMALVPGSYSFDEVTEVVAEISHDLDLVDVALINQAAGF
jgi:hypothetical protein